MSKSIVSGFTPLPGVSHRSQEEYASLGQRFEAVPVPMYVYRPKVEDLWVCRELKGTPLPDRLTGDNKDTFEYMAFQLEKSHMIRRHLQNTSDDVVAWVDYGIFHLQDVREEDIVQFYERLMPSDKIVAPRAYPLGSRGFDPDYPYWYFLGGVLIVPRTLAHWFADAVERETALLVKETGRLSWETNIWYRIAMKHPEKFGFYHADHARTLFTNYPGNREEDRSMDTLAIKHGTDKSSQGNDYMGAYELMFAPLREKPVNLLEIGVYTGDSLRMWKEAFPNGQILGIDCSPECKKHEEDRIKVAVAKQDESIVLSSLGQEYGPFDVIIDDGSHRSEDMLASLYSLWPYLKAGGLYVLEDLACSFLPSVYGSHAGRGHPRSIVEWLKQLQDVLHAHPGHGGCLGDDVTSQIVSVYCHQMMAFLRKGHRKKWKVLVDLREH